MHRFLSTFPVDPPLLAPIAGGAMALRMPVRGTAAFARTSVRTLPFFACARLAGARPRGYDRRAQSNPLIEELSGA